MSRTRGRDRHRPLRILYPASLTAGGAERQMLFLAEHLPRDEFRVDFVMLGGWTPNAEAAVAAGARATALGVPRRGDTSRPLQMARVAATIPRFIAICRRERYDIADAWLFMGSAMVALTRPLTRIPVLIEGRRSLSGYKERFGLAERLLDRMARPAAEVIVANARAVADDVERREGIDPGRIRVIHNGVEIPPPLTDGARAALRAGWGAVEDDVVIGVVGVFKPGKGQEAVIEALAADPMALGASRLDHLRLVLVGDGPRRPAIEDLIRRRGLANRVTLTGLVPDARPLYGGFDVVASASDAEGLPNVVLEAAAAGRAIVATDVGGTSEIVDDGVSGRLVPTGDRDALAAALAELVRDPGLRDAYGRAARDHVADAFSVARFVAETASLYRELAARHGLR